MSAQGNRIWVVITDGVNTRICSCQDGMATPISTPLFHFDASDSVDSDVRAYKAWFKPERQGWFSRSPKRQHVLHVSQLLLEAARERAYDGLIIIATDRVATKFKDALAPETRALLIGKVISDYATLELSAPCEPPEMRH